jgi:hypothetical protein
MCAEVKAERGAGYGYDWREDGSGQVLCLIARKEIGRGKDDQQERNGEKQYGQAQSQLPTGSLSQLRWVVLAPNAPVTWCARWRPPALRGFCRGICP